MPRDPWIQLFAFLALVSGVVWAAGLRRPAPIEPLPAAAPAPQVASPAEAPRAGPKTPGRWVVDPKGGPDADSASLGEALARAEEGDVIALRPWVYREGLVLAKSVTLVGEGKSRQDVWIDQSGGATLKATRGRVAIKHLSLSNTGEPGLAALEVRGAQVSLEDVAVKSSGRGARVLAGSLRAEGSSFDCRVALSVGGTGELSLEGGSVAGSQTGVLVEGDSASARLNKVKFRDGARAVSVEGPSRVSLESPEFDWSGPGGGVFAFSGAQVSLRGAKFRLNRSAKPAVYAEKSRVSLQDSQIQGSQGSGIVASGSDLSLERVSISRSHTAGVVAGQESRVTISDSRISDNDDCAVQIHSASLTLRGLKSRGNLCGLAFHGPGTVQAYDSEFSDHEPGGVMARPGLEKEIVLKGSGNKGLTLGPPAQARLGGPQGQGPVKFNRDIFNRYRKSQ